LTIDRTKQAISQIRKPERWLDDVARRGHGTEECLGLAQSERISELLIMGLRLTGGIPRERFRDEAESDIEAALDPARLAELQAMGLLILDRDGLRATPRGRQRLDSVLSRLLG
jgi:coproporphyrinogen III oxidase-like Fe-S oxidoreductase